MHPYLNANEIVGKIPESDWLRFGILLLVVLACIQAFRLVSRVNRSLLIFILVVGCAILFSSWVRNRNEPELLTPVIDMVAPWFPSEDRPWDA